MNAPEGGLVWHCYECNRTWDSLELLAEVFHRGELRDAIQQVLREPEFLLPQEMLVERAINDYILDHSAPRKSVRRWSREARRHWSEHRDLHAILSDNIGVTVHLLESQEAITAGVGRWLHATSRKDIMDQLNHGIPPGLSQSSFRTCLALPWGNTLGRVSSLLLLGWRRSVRMWFPAHAENQKDPGLMLMDALPRNPKRVAAFSSPWLALWLQYRRFQEDNNPLPLVAWHQDTDPTIWAQLGVEEVVFWDYAPTAALFKQALSATADASVSYLENPSFPITYLEKSIETYQTWRELRELLDVSMPARQRVEELIVRRRPAYEAFRDFLLVANPEDVSAILDTVDLSIDQRLRLLETCRTYEERAILEKLLEHRTRVRETIMFGGTVVQYIGPDESHWSLRRRGVEERISDAVVELDRCIRDDESKETFYTGVIHHRGHRYPMSTTQRELRNNALGVIVNTVESAGGTTPFVSNSQQQRLWDMAHRFSHIEKTIKALTRVGWDDRRQGFLFPRFAIRGGVIEEKSSLGLTGDVLPGLRVDRPGALDTAVVDAWLEPTDANGTMWALLAALITNLLGGLDREQPRGIGLVGDLATAAADKLAADMGLLDFNLERVRGQFGEFDKSQRDHDLPVLVRDTEARSVMPLVLSDWLALPQAKNVLMSLSPMQIATAVMCGNWIVVDTGEDEGDYYRECEIAALLVHYLAHYQRGIGRLPKAPSPSHATLLGLQEWATSVGTQDPAFVFKYASDALRDSGREPFAARFVYLVAQMLHDGYLKREYGIALKEDGSGSAVVIDSENKRVFVSKQKIVEALARRQLPLLDTLATTVALREAGALIGEHGTDRAGWVIDGKFWERRARKWAKTYEAHSG
jgi:hypothetical protein